MLHIGDVIELVEDIKNGNLRAGSRGTVVHQHSAEDFEIEFTDDDGQTTDLLALGPEQFIVVWRSDTRQWVPVSEQICALLEKMPDEIAVEVLDFARFISVRKRPVPISLITEEPMKLQNL